jgi:CDP-glucose 4,6-dehydratase
LETALQKIIDWHRAWREGADMRNFSLKQISEYQNTFKV